ncbi:MAG: HEPN domain-containing protein [Deltaproteobacteria bacterium]|nr:HEPN domain-containing protein [Deltaproteobacteria bacterium]
MQGLAKEADRWFRQAENDLKAAQWCEQGGFYAQACFWAQQSAAKALRALLFMNKEDTKETRSVSELLERCLTYDEDFKPIVEPSGRLDIYYKTSRYPDSLPGGIPAELISARDSKESIKIASDIFTLVEEKRKAYVPEVM